MTFDSFGLDLRDVFGYPIRGGTVTALCAWKPPRELVCEAKGQPLHLACWVYSADGSEVLVAGGPRSRAVATGASIAEQQVGVVLPVPTLPGHYKLALDAVVEHQFWASSRGTPPHKLDAERLPDGGITISEPSSGRHFVIEGGARQFVPIRDSRYGLDCSERAVEIPWVVSCLAELVHQGGRHVLDVGYAFAEPAYETALADLGIPVLIGVDLVASPKSHLRPYVADVRWPALRTRSLDVILAISVLEHIGRDNATYGSRYVDPASKTGDQHAIRALADLVKPGGHLILTVPFGKAEDHGWFVQHDRRGLARLINASGMDVEYLQYFGYRNGWCGPLDPRSLSGVRYGVGTPAAGAVACAVLRRTASVSSSTIRTLAQRPVPGHGGYALQ